jgi:hypothetical protein
MGQFVMAVPQRSSSYAKISWHDRQFLTGNVEKTGMNDVRRCCTQRWNSSRMPFKLFDNKKGGDSPPAHPNKINVATVGCILPPDLFTRPPIFPIATCTFWASTPPPTSLAFRWFPSTSAALSLWRIGPTFEALAMT